MRKPLDLGTLQAMLSIAISDKNNPNINYSAPCKCSDLGFYKLGFSPSGYITLWEWIGYNDDDSSRYGESVSASNFHSAYIKVLELLISRYNEV